MMGSQPNRISLDPIETESAASNSTPTSSKVFFILCLVIWLLLCGYVATLEKRLSTHTYPPPHTHMHF